MATSPYKARIAALPLDDLCRLRCLVGAYRNAVDLSRHDFTFNSELDRVVHYAGGQIEALRMELERHGLEVTEEVLEAIEEA